RSVGMDRGATWQRIEGQPQRTAPAAASARPRATPLAKVVADLGGELECDGEVDVSIGEGTVRGCRSLPSALARVLPQGCRGGVAPVRAGARVSRHGRLAVSARMPVRAGCRAPN